ncbi:MAG: TatD family nuclease-associated radical SAM protein [Thermoplasmata archaeon]|nr:TatD family nuclease-associated radical SAM protein [Thermoplasmata archaeon]
MSSILYRYGSTWYINMTNRCPCRCTFCVRNHVRKLGDADCLWLVNEPTAEEVEAEIRSKAPDADEIVFCGYGEPTERLDDLLEIARWIRANTDARIRLDTNGLGNLVNGRDIVPDLAGVLDAVSISLNAPDPEEYMEVCRPSFGEAAYPALLSFIEEAAASIPDVTVSVVGGSISLESEERCRAMAGSWGVDFRVR